MRVFRESAARAVAGFGLTCLLSACGGGSGGAGQSTEPPPVVTQRITFASSTTRTAFAAGAVPFQLTTALPASERVVCKIDDVEVTPCLDNERTGRIRFAGLGTGAHILSVQIIRDTAQPVERSDHTLRIEQVGLVVFAATPGGIAAAIAAAQSGVTVALLERTNWVGGMLSGGLGKTDIGPRGHEVIGGLTLDFFRRVQAAELASGACSGQCAGLYDLEPHVGEQVFESMLREAGVIVERNVELLGVTQEGTDIRRLATSRGEIGGRVFIDASYEGDLMAAAGIEYALGREPRQLASPGDPAALAVQEDYAGVQRYRLPMGTLRADPFVVPNDATSGTLSYIEPRPEVMPSEGDGDDRVMAYTYRLCVTDDPSNRIAFTAPPGYDPLRYEASARVVQAWVQRGVDPAVAMFNPAATVRSKDRSYQKYDLNGGSTFSIDMTGRALNQAYVEGSATERDRIRAEYRDYISGLLYFWQTDVRFLGLNQKLARFGYCADEFLDHGNWPHQLYVREARRMMGEYVMYEADVLQNGRRPPITDSVGFGVYDIDMHTHRYLAAPVDWPDGSRHEAITNEGFLIVHLPNNAPYPVSYRALVPRASAATNFLNPVTPSSTHVAFSSLRVEPTLMTLGEAAGVAASMAIQNQTSVQAVPYAELRQRLLSRGMKLSI
jgi:hypothetical protein